MASLWVAWPPSPNSDSDVNDEIEQPVFIAPDIVQEKAKEEPPHRDAQIPTVSEEPVTRPVHNSKPEPVVALKPIMKPKVGATNKAASPPITQNLNWIVQVGTFSDQANAEKLNKQLKANNYPSFLQPITLAKSRKATRVRVGPFGSQTKANEIRDALKRQLKINGFVKKSEPAK